MPCGRRTATNRRTTRRSDLNHPRGGVTLITQNYCGRNAVLLAQECLLPKMAAQHTARRPKRGSQRLERGTVWHKMPAATRWR